MASANGQFAYERSLRSDLAYVFERGRRLLPSPHLPLSGGGLGTAQCAEVSDAGTLDHSQLALCPEERGGGGRSVLRSCPSASSSLNVSLYVQIQPSVARCVAYWTVASCTEANLDSSRSAARRTPPRPHILGSLRSLSSSVVYVSDAPCRLHRRTG